MGVKEDGLLTGTYFFIGLFIIGALIMGQYAHYTTKDRSAAGANRGLAWSLTFMGVFCMWLFWACVYMHQMYPLVQPIIEAH